MPYKAHIRRWNGEKFQKIEVGVSVGNQDYEGKKLEALIAYINTLNSEEVIIEVCDTLQRWNDPNLDEKRALKNGDKWIERNKTILERLTSPWKLIRWDIWLKSAEFERAIKQVVQLYNENKEFQQAILTTAIEVLERFQNYNKIGEISPEDSKLIIRENSIKYLLEEIAVIMILWTSDRDQIDLFYPNKMTDALVAGHKFLVENCKEGKRKLNWQEIRFTKVAENDNNINQRMMISKSVAKSYTKNNGKSSLSLGSTAKFFDCPKLIEGEELIVNLPRFKKNLKTLQQLLAIKDDDNINPQLVHLRKQIISSDILSDIQVIHDLLLNETESTKKTPIRSF